MLGAGLAGPLVAALLAIAGASAARAAEASGEAPLCEASLHLEAEHALVGQQILYEIHILRRKDVTQLAWDPAPGFPAFRAEWLPGISGDAPVIRDGESYDLYRERRALFPARAGVLAVPPAGLRCATAGGEELVAVPGGRVAVEPVPEPGRPAGYDGLVGPVEVSVTASPAALALGGSVRISVALRGRANLWDAGAPLAAAAWPDAELFAHPPELSRDAGRELRLRRYFVYDLVPRREGRLRIPAVAVAWFDPETRRYRVAESLALEVAVGPAPAAAAPAERAPGGAEDPVAPGGDGRRTWGVLLGALVLVAALLAFYLVRQGVHHGVRRGAGRAPDFDATGALSKADSLPADAMARALRAALAARLPGVASLSSDEIVAGAPDALVREAGELLMRLDRARFEPGAPAPDPEAVRACLDALRARP